MPASRNFLGRLLHLEACLSSSLRAMRLGEGSLAGGDPQDALLWLERAELSLSFGLALVSFLERHKAGAYSRTF